MPNKAVSITELKKKTFFSLKVNKSAGYDYVSFDVLRNCFGKIYGPLQYIFSISLEKGVFPDNLKIAIISLMFKTGEKI